jgi:hypothetical protein
MDSIQRLNEVLSLAEEEIILTKEIVRDILNSVSSKDYELEDDEELTVTTIKISYDEYKAYGLSYENKMIIPAGDYLNYLRDIANEFCACLPNDFEVFFNESQLYNKMLQDNSYMEQAVDFINKNNHNDHYKYVATDSTTFNNVEYVIIKEEI